MKLATHAQARAALKHEQLMTQVWWNTTLLESYRAKFRQARFATRMRYRLVFA